MIETKEVLSGLKKSNFVNACGLPMGYVQGLPILHIKNDRLCMTVPYLKYKITGEVDKTYVYPIKFTVTLSLPENKIIAFKDLEFEPAFKKVAFLKPVGLFRHDAIKHLNKNEYAAKKDELFSQYDRIINALLYSGEYSATDEQRMSELIQLLIEPSLKPIYKALDSDFYNKYIA